MRSETGFAYRTLREDFAYVFYLMCRSILPASTFLMQHQIPWNWSDGWLWASMWMLGTEHRYPARTTSAFIGLDISLAHAESI